MTLNDLKKTGIFDLMPNGFNVYDYESDSLIESSNIDWDSKVEIIGADPEEFIPAIYISNV